MPVVIDEMESTVEPGGSQPAAASAEAGGKGGESKALQRDQLANELQRIAARRERLKAD